MVLTGKVTGQFQTKSDTSKFYELFKLLPDTFSTLIPSKVRSVDLLEGEFGAIGCVMLVKYIKAIVLVLFYDTND
ncbi:hypothetical protein LIER_38302 [Lithospermum erythrorhizon]|uniref:Bet v I/Major latex protein domain-containing protein n=1 Tax=Lithospermum erythrorhizon TaxID=34254 RepID=A0AAV3Q2Y5_LITER